MRTRPASPEDVGRVVPAAEPGLDHGDVDPAGANSANAAAVSTSNCVAPTSSAAVRTRSSAALEVGLLAADVDALAPAETCGDVYVPTLEPLTREQRLQRAPSMVVFPFVPTTWMAGKARCGSPSASGAARMRPSPNSSGQGAEALEP